jgi:hypothetical protein
VANPLFQTVTPLPAEGKPAPSDPPTVVSVQRFGVHMQPTVLVLGFSEGLDPAFAEDLRNYKIVGPSGRSIRIRSASYDPTAKTVTLLPRTRINLHHNYHLTVNGTGAGGVTDAQGTSLDGADNGLPGSNYTATLNWRDVVLTPAEIRKYDHPQPAKPVGPLGHR